MKAPVRTVIALMILFFTSWTPAVYAFDPGNDMLFLAREDRGASDRGERNSEPSPRIGRQQAATIVKRRYGDGKILAVNLTERKGMPVYRIKVLSGDGVVKYVFVDGMRGNVFE